MNRPEGSKRNLRSNSSVRRTSAAAGTPASTRPTRSRIAETSRRPTQSQTTPTDTHRVLRQHSQPSWEPLQQDWRDRMHQHDQQPMYSASPTAEQQDDIHRLFQSLDHKGRGVISSHKLRVAMAEMGLDAPTAEELNEWVAEVDPKDTGRINYEQFEEFMARRLDEADQQDQMMNAFRL
ncbi:centrin, EF-hand protein, partial [Linderina pennispora]